MAKLADALRSGRSGSNPVEVQVLFRPRFAAPSLTEGSGRQNALKHIGAEGYHNISI
jgi:hypothetical protein